MSKKIAASEPVSDSVAVLMEHMDDQGVTKTDFARQMGVSPDYVYRILKGRVPFPRVRETIDKMAVILHIDPHVFAEYREIQQGLSASTRLVWQRMKELGLAREAVFDAMGGRISRPYFNSILRGDQPFPSNRAYIQLFALALELPPAVFREYGPITARWEADDLRSLEEQVYNLAFDKMLADQDFSREPLQFTLLGDVFAQLFPPRERRSAELVAVLTRMGDLGMGISDLEKLTGIPLTTLRTIMANESAPVGLEAEMALIRCVLRISRD